MQITFAVAALLFGAEALKIQREPLLSNEKFFVTAAPKTKAQKEDWPKGYAVPNFGVDHDIKASQKHLADQERIHKHVFDAERWNKKPDHPVDYFVPNFGLDRDILTTQKNIADAESKYGKWNPELVQLDEQREPLLSRADHFVTAAKTPKSQQEKWPKDYAVPNFGVDKDVIATQKHIADQEKRLKHKYVPDSLKKPTPIPRDYPVPNFGMDQDILTTHKNLRAAEAKYGPWNVNQLMLEEFVAIDAETEREPLLSAGVVETASPWKHFPKEKWPINYGIANLGVDSDIAATQKHEAYASKVHKHVWSMKGKKFHEVPKETTEFKL